MLEKVQEKNKAIELRKHGLSYKEILEQIPVEKSSLSIWLRNVRLAKKQEQILSSKKMAGMRRGWEARHAGRIRTSIEIKNKAAGEINTISVRELWLMGVAMYWAEGSKEKEYNPGSGIRFSNSDPKMLKLFLKWLIEITKTPKEDIYFEIYIHENHRDRVKKISKYWADVINFPIDYFNRVYFKRNKTNTNRKNISANYNGLLRIMVKKSSNLNRKIQGWIDGINKHCGVV